MKCYNLETALRYPFKTTHLYLHGLRLEVFPEEVFYFPNLKHLDVSLNNIKTLPEDLLKLENLEGLNVSENELKTIPPFFNQLTTLKELNLSKNQFFAFPLLDQLASLIKFDCSYNQIESLPRWIGKWKQLESINIAFNRIRQLPASIGAWKELRLFFAQHNLISRIPNSIKHWTQIHTIHLEHNHLKLVPEGISQPPFLQRLYLEYNRLTHLPDTLGEANMLQRLHLQHNKLTSLPSSIVNLKQLQVLNLSKNKLHNLPEAIGSCRHLIRLIASQNQLTDLPVALAQLNHLQELDVSKNKLTQFPPAIASLQTLTLNRNPIADLPAYFWGMNKLQQFTGLENRYPLRLRRRIFEFKATWLKAGFSTNWHPLLWKSINGEAVDYSVFSKAQLFRLLFFKSKYIKQLAYQELTKKENAKADEIRFLGSASIALLGRSRFSKAFWKKHLEKMELSFEQKPSPDTTYVILGSSPKNYQYLLDTGVVFVSEKMACLQLVRLYQRSGLEMELSEREREKVKVLFDKYAS